MKAQTIAIINVSIPTVNMAVRVPMPHWMSARYPTYSPPISNAPDSNPVILAKTTVIASFGTQRA